ncbi:hypothetical protein ABPG72_021305 [Tetrahymena utriculariae]
MAVDIMYRGLDIIPKDVGWSFSSWKQKRTLSFVSWCKDFIQLRIIYSHPCMCPENGFAYSDKSVFMISNSTSISEVLQRINNRFDQMFTKREYTHLYKCEGMEEIELIQAREELASQNKDYQDAVKTIEFEEEN